MKTLYNHTIEIVEAKNGQSKKVILDGKTYSSINQFRSEVSLSETFLSTLKKTYKCDLETAILEGLRIKDEKHALSEARLKEYEKRTEEKKQRAKEREFIFQNIRYSSFASAVSSVSEAYQVEIHESSIINKAKRENKPLVTAMEEMLVQKITKEEKRKDLLKKKYKCWYSLSSLQIAEEIKDYLYASPYTSYLENDFALWVSKITEIKLPLVRAIIIDLFEREMI